MSNAIHKRHGAYLPHWEKEGAIYSVTYRLADSVPKSVIQRWQSERWQIIKNAKKQNRPLTSDERIALYRIREEKIQMYLDRGRGSCWLAKDNIAPIIANCFVHDEGKKYAMFAWCVMPNHIHAVLQPLGTNSLPSIICGWKTYSSRESNILLDRNGTFWHAEYYDHVIRNDRELQHCISYTWNNPDVAGLKDWGWRWKCGDVCRCG